MSTSRRLDWGYCYRRTLCLPSMLVPVNSSRVLSDVLTMSVSRNWFPLASRFTDDDNDVILVSVCSESSWELSVCGLVTVVSHSHQLTLWGVKLGWLGNFFVNVISHDLQNFKLFMQKDCVDARLIFFLNFWYLYFPRIWKIFVNVISEGLQMVQISNFACGDHVVRGQCKCYILYFFYKNTQNSIFA